MSAFFHVLHVERGLELSKDRAALRDAFCSLQTPRDVADLLECSYQQLIYWTKVAGPTTRYSTFEIDKSSGAKRRIEAPTPVLRVLQRKLLRVLESVFEPRSPVHGFTKSRDITTNAAQHVRRAWVLNIDLLDFFPSIHFGRVRGILRARPFELPDEVAITLARLACSEGRLPQGAPTSPILSNIICAKMDGELRRFTKEAGAFYTRYADDMTFSVRRRGFPQALAMIREPEPGVFVAELSDALTEIIEANGFLLNDAKVRIQPWKRSQRVTGLVVNERVNVPRRFVRRTRAMLHACRVHGLPAAQKRFEEQYAGPCRNKGPRKGGAKHPQLIRRIRGNIAYIGNVRGRDDALYLRLLAQYHALVGKKSTTLPAAMADNETTRDVFICHAREDKPLVVEPLVAELQRKGRSVWYDKQDISWGDSITARINEGLLAARYVIVVLSAAFLDKHWPQRELAAALNREISSGTTTVLPLVVGNPDEVRRLLEAFPFLADKRQLKWDRPGHIAEKLDELFASSASSESAPSPDDALGIVPE